MTRAAPIYFQCDYALMLNAPHGRDYLDAANFEMTSPMYKYILFGSS